MNTIQQIRELFASTEDGEKKNTIQHGWLTQRMRLMTVHISRSNFSDMHRHDIV